MSDGRENRELLEALEALNSRRSLAVVQRTRRKVMETAHRMQASRRASRKRLGFALLVFALFLLLTTPALWSFCEAVFGGKGMTDSSILALTLFVMLLSTLLGAVLGRNKRRGRASQ